MSETLAWRDPAHPVPVQYAPETLERIRLLSFDGLLSLPRVGLGVGGFLLGIRQPGGICITGFTPIDCSHANGPSFAPTAAEIEQAIGSVEASEVVGCYCSRPRRPIEITEKDRTLFQDLCTGPRPRVFLLVRPSATEDTRAAMFYRKSDGTISGGVEHPLLPFALERIAEPTPEPEPIPVLESEPPAPEPIEFPPAPAPALPGSAPAVPAPAPALPAPDLFGEPEPIRPPAFLTLNERRRVPWRLLGSVAATLSFVVASWVTRDQWIERPALELRTAEIDGHFSFEWNRAAVRGLGSGRLTVFDGTASKIISLDRSQLEAGAFPYARQSPQVTGELVAGTAHASAKFVAPPQPVLPVLPDVPAR